MLEVRSFSQPNESAQLTGEIVCILLGIKPSKVREGVNVHLDYWSPFKKILVSDFASLMRKYELDNVDLKMYNQVRKRFDAPNFQPAKLKATSQALPPIRDWIEKILSVFESHN